MGGIIVVICDTSELHPEGEVIQLNITHRVFVMEMKVGKDTYIEPSPKLVRRVIEKTAVDCIGVQHDKCEHCLRLEVNLNALLAEVGGY